MNSYYISRYSLTFETWVFIVPRKWIYQLTASETQEENLYLHSLLTTIMRKGYINWCIHAIWLKQVSPHPAIVNSYLCLQHWFDQSYDNTFNKYINNAHNNESTHVYNTYSGDNWVCWKQIGYIIWGSYKNKSLGDI